MFTDDSVDIFPKNFILALDRPSGYMGVADFHDVEWNTEDDKTDPAASNEAAFVRSVGPPPEPNDVEQVTGRLGELRRALDSFVLAGAVKVFRENGGAKPFRHHTMLVHEATARAEHRDLADLVRDVWRTSRYGQPGSLVRLKALWRDDFYPVCAVRAEGHAFPADFEDLIKPIGEACRRVNELGDPVLIVNSDADVQTHQQALDFDRNDVWRILVGGAKLSRGFTVEGLTTSFYTRKALQGDTLMQAGRWFGFRRGYRDLVRLFIRRDPADATRPVDLYEAFEGLMRDEESMRSRLRDYEGFNDDGSPILEPWQVPPIVTQSLPYLRPTGRTKMFNAVITSFGDAGRLKDYYGVPPRTQRSDKRSNYELLSTLLKKASERRTFTAGRSKSEDRFATFEALTGIVSARDFLRVFQGLRWHPDYQTKVITPALRFYKDLMAGGGLDDLVLVWPQLVKSVELRELPGIGEGQIVTRSRRVPPRLDFVGSDSKHRDALETIAGAHAAGPDTVAHSLRVSSGCRGAVLLYVTGDLGEAPSEQQRKRNAADLPARPQAEDLVVLMSLVAPATATPNGGSVIEWTVRRESGRGTAAVPTSGA